MNRILSILILIPTLLYAGSFTANKPKKMEQPLGTIDRMSLRTPNSKTFQDSASFNAGRYIEGQFITVFSPVPIHYDSAGVMVEINYEEKDTTGLYDKIIRRGGGRMNIQYSTTKPGAVRVGRRGGWLEYIPAWDTSNLSVVVDINDNGWKETLILDSNSPTRLAWGFDYTSVHEKEVKGKGRIKNILAQTVAELGEYKAWNQRNEPVTVTATYTADSLIVSIPAIMAGDTVYLDPYVQDTTQTDSSRAIGFYSPARSATTAAYSEGRLYVHHLLDDSTTGRSYISYDVSLATRAAVIDSAFIRWVNTSAGEGAGYDSTVMVKSSSSGVGAGGSFISFDGWASSGAYSPTIFSDTLTGMATPDTSYFRLNAAARAVLLDSLGVGQFSVHVLNLGDIKNVVSSYFVTATTSFGPDIPLLLVYYTSANLPGITTVNTDTLRYVQKELYGTIDSTGGSNLTVRGFESFIVGGDSASLTVVSDTGDYTAGSFSHLSPLFMKDTSYVIRAFGINKVGTSRGVRDTISTATGTGGTLLKVDGRTVNSIR